MGRKKSSSKRGKADGRRGKRRRKDHIIYAIEKTLGFNHENIAALAQRNYVSLDEIRQVCQHPLRPLPRSDLTPRHVSKMIVGEYPESWALVKRRLAYRLGISLKSIEEYDRERSLTF
jgi:hypothetical protein